jgi:hypothetical protein
MPQNDKGPADKEGRMTKRELINAIEATDAPDDAPVVFDPEGNLREQKWPTPAVVSSVRAHLFGPGADPDALVFVELRPLTKDEGR